MKRSTIIFFTWAALVCVSCTSNTNNADKKYIDDTIVHEADSPIIRDRSMVPKPDTTDRNLNDPNSKNPEF